MTLSDCERYEIDILWNETINSDIKWVLNQARGFCFDKAALL